MGIKQYNRSRDYKLLVELVKEQNIACEVSYGKCLRTTAWVKKSPYSGELAIRAYGVSYITANTDDEFMHKCWEANVEFIIPNMD